MRAGAAQAIAPPSPASSHGGIPGVVALTRARAHRAVQALEAWVVSEDSCQRPLPAGERDQERLHPPGRWQPKNFVDEK